MKKNAILTMIRTLFSMLIPLITFPYITRILTVEEIGQFNFSNSVISYFVLVAGLGINTYAIKEGAKIRNVKTKINSFASEMYLINLISTLIAYVVLGVLLVGVSKFRSYNILILILSLSIFLNCFSRQWIFNVYENFTTITVVQIVLQVISMCAIFMFIKNPGDINKYAWIYVFSSSGSYFLYGLISKRYVDIRLRKVQFSRLKKHIKPIFIIFGMAIATTIYANSDITILGFLVDDYTVGIYSTAVKIYNIVKQILVAVITVTVPRLSMYAGTSNYKKLFRKVFDALTFITLPAVAGLYILSDEVVQVVAGEKYITASGSLKILCFAIICALFANLFGTCVLLPYNKELIFLNATIISACVNALLNFLLIPIWGEKAAAFTTALSQLIVLVIHFLWSKKYVELRKSLKCIVQCMFGVVAVVIVCNFVKRMVFTIYTRIIVAILFSAITYGICEIVLRNEFVMEFILNAKSKIKKLS